MAIHSVGYGGTVNELGWSQLAPQLGARFSVVGAEALQVSALGTPARSVQIAPGAAQGYGVFDTSDAPEVLTGDPTSTSRWDTVALRRNWQNNTSSLVLVPGSSQRRLSPNLENTPGVVADQPLALVNFTGASTPGTIVDLRVWSGNGGLFTRNDDGLQALEADIGTHVRVGSGSKFMVRTFAEGGAPYWRDVHQGLLTEDTGLVPVFASNSQHWQRSLRWWQVGTMTTLMGRTLRRSTTTPLRSPGNSSTMYRLPTHLRPNVQYRTMAISRRNSDRDRGIFSVYIEPSGHVTIYNSDPNFNITPNTAYHFNITYRTTDN